LRTLRTLELCLSSERTDSAKDARIMEKQHTPDDNEHLEPDRPPPSPTDSAGATQKASRRPRGFAAMDRKLVSEIARKGGKAAHSAGTAHEFTSEEAREAGRKGGQASHANRRKSVGESSRAPGEGEKS
jgi:general stress protein YciG